MAKLYEVPFLGAGVGPIMLQVIYIAEYARGEDGTCAFCHGDPCAEMSGPETHIGAFRQRLGKAFETCPCCNGRPT